jgi:hypothetical protein
MERASAIDWCGIFKSLECNLRFISKANRFCLGFNITSGLAATAHGAL